MKTNFFLESNKKSMFEIWLENIDNILNVNANNLSIIPSKNCYKELTLEQMQENKFFCICDSIFEEINELTEIKKAKIEE